MLKFIKNLESAEKVAALQSFFGVTYNKKTIVAPKCEGCHSKEESSVMLRKLSTAKSPDNQGRTIQGQLSDAECQMMDTNNFDDSKTQRIEDTIDSKNYRVKYKFWYYLFLFGTHLGDVIGYAVFLPLLFWNIDGVIARKLVLVWSATMYIGQALKEIFRRVRPDCPPVVRLQKKWSKEYGMPSTHAMVGVAFPSSILYYGARRYYFPFEYGLIVAILWCTLISFSRLYLGMHSILDVLAGFVISSMLLIPILPLMDYIGDAIADYNYCFPFVIVLLSIFLILIYPKLEGPLVTATKEDTTTILATCVGLLIGSWLNYELGFITDRRFSKNMCTWPDWSTLGFGSLRLVVGLICMVISFVFFEFFTKVIYWAISRTNLSFKDTNAKGRVPNIDLFIKYLTYCVISGHVSFSIPLLFKYLHIGRVSYYEE